MKALARYIVRRHPAAWRRRYEDEVMALIDDRGARIRDIADLARSALAERVLSWYEPSQHIARFRLISGLVVTAFGMLVIAVFFAVGAVPWAVGYGVLQAWGPFPAPVAEAVAWLPVPLMIAVLACWFRLVRQRKWGTRAVVATPLDRRLVWAMLACCGMVGFLNGAAVEPSWSMVFNSGYLPVMMVLQIFEPSDIRWPGSDLLDALGRLRATRYALRWARMELTRCEGLYEGRDAGPELRAARHAMNLLLADEAQAMADLTAMGYDARFQA